MTQNADVKSELSDFNDIDSRDLRDYNRGAVLANIHSKYSLDKGAIPANRVGDWLSELDGYLIRIPKDEVITAKASMRLHLEKRGEM